MRCDAFYKRSVAFSRREESSPRESVHKKIHSVDFYICSGQVHGATANDSIPFPPSF